MKRTATIVSFRARADIEDPTTLQWVKNRVSTFKGIVLGTTGDGYDVVAAFHTEDMAERFLNRYFEGDLDGPIGTYVVAETTL